MFGRRRQSKRLGIYIHIPFCISKCAYCDFYSYAPRDTRVFSAYVDALISHMQSYRVAGGDYSPDTVFIGGGTPTVLPEEEMLRLLKAIKTTFHLQKNVEFTMECNPATVTLPMLKKYRRAGVNRLSIGLQSANQNELSALGRIHNISQFEESYKIAREAKIDNISIDLMYGIPYQTLDSWMTTLRYVVSLCPEHISLYNLKLEEGTPLYANAANLPLPDEETEFAMYSYAIDFLAQHGYKQYEISNFAREGYESQHNLKYWHCEEYLGFGPGAHSYFKDIRFSYKRNITNYIKCNNGVSDEEMTDDYEEIPLRERLGEYIMLHMRLTEGVDVRKFFMLFGKDFEREYGVKLHRYVKGGLVEFVNGCYRFTRSGMFVSNYILSDILDFGE